MKDLEGYLGYPIVRLVKALRRDLHAREGEERSLLDALNDGYHVDHIYPLSRFMVVRPDGTVDWQEFQRCWAITNLRAIPASENLAKGAKVF